MKAAELEPEKFDIKCYFSKNKECGFILLADRIDGILILRLKDFACFSYANWYWVLRFLPMQTTSYENAQKSRRGVKVISDHTSIREKKA